MPHTNRKKKGSGAKSTQQQQKPVHTKRQEVEGDDGWTHVIEGKKHASHAKAQSISKNPELHGGDFLLNGVSYIERTLDEMTADQEHFSKQWEADEACATLKAQLEAVQGNTIVMDVVCLGLGSLQSSRREGRRASHTQLAALRTIMQQLDLTQCHIQDPQFTTLDKQYLTALGYTIAEDPTGYTHITENSLVYAIHCYADIYEKVADGPRPALLVATDVKNFENKDGKEKLDAMVEGCEALDFPQVRHDFSDTKLYWRKTSGPVSNLPEPVSTEVESASENDIIAEDSTLVLETTAQALPEVTTVSEETVPEITSSKDNNGSKTTPETQAAEPESSSKNEAQEGGSTAQESSQFEISITEIASAPKTNLESDQASKALDSEPSPIPEISETSNESTSDIKAAEPVANTEQVSAPETSQIEESSDVKMPESIPVSEAAVVEQIEESGSQSTKELSTEIETPKEVAKSGEVLASTVYPKTSHQAEIAGPVPASEDVSGSDEIPTAKTVDMSVPESKTSELAAIQEVLKIEEIPASVVDTQEPIAPPETTEIASTLPVESEPAEILKSEEAMKFEPAPAPQTLDSLEIQQSEAKSIPEIEPKDKSAQETVPTLPADIEPVEAQKSEETTEIQSALALQKAGVDLELERSEMESIPKTDSADEATAQETVVEDPKATIEVPESTPSPKTSEIGLKRTPDIEGLEAPINQEATKPESASTPQETNLPIEFNPQLSTSDPVISQENSASAPTAATKSQTSSPEDKIVKTEITVPEAAATSYKSPESPKSPRSPVLSRIPCYPL